MDPKMFVWTEKYRPKTIEDVILPERIISVFREYVEQSNIPPLLLSGGPGVGKTTIAKALCNDINCDYMVVNGSLDLNLEMLRTTISNFASTVSLRNPGKRKYVIVDEADNFTSPHIQKALRNFIESFSENCGFILTCNYPNQIIEPLRSRCSVVDFSLTKEEQLASGRLFFKRVREILTEQNISFTNEVLAEYLKKYFPDWRKVLNEVQGGIAQNQLTPLSTAGDYDFDSLIKSMKAKDIKEIKEWIANRPSVVSADVFRYFYDHVSRLVKEPHIPGLIVCIGEYQYKHSFVADPEINLVAFLVEVMATCEWK